mmetsp:Transcript_94911/g.306921  ORF Transcript_94911/g.306921 Transcript_94911/m.306921 type:complete len:210 (-) Transcript_94911:855-1484(-)
MVRARSSIWAATSVFSRSLVSVCAVFVLNSSTQKSLCLISAAFSLPSWRIMSSMAFLTRSKASSLTLVARADRYGEWNFLALNSSTRAAAVRRLLISAPLCTWTNDGLKVFVNRSCASSPDRTAKALETASISNWRVFCLSSHSPSVIWHFSFSMAKNCSSAVSDSLVSLMSSLDCAFFSSVSARVWVLAPIWSWPLLISSSFATLRSS